MIFVSFRCVVQVVALAFIGENTVALRGLPTVGCFMWLPFWRPCSFGDEGTHRFAPLVLLALFGRCAREDIRFIGFVGALSFFEWKWGRGSPAAKPPGRGRQPSLPAAVAAGTARAEARANAAPELSRRLSSGKRPCGRFPAAAHCRAPPGAATSPQPLTFPYHRKPSLDEAGSFFWSARLARVYSPQYT